MSGGRLSIGLGGYLFLGFIFMIVVLVFFLLFTTSVPAGNVGVLNTFGSVEDRVLQPGFHVKNPFTAVIPMSTRTMKYIDYGKDDKATIVALSNDGMSTTMGIAVNYHLNPAKVVELYKNVGENYPDVVMVNPIHSVPRDLIAKYDTKTLYSASKEGTSDRLRVEQELYSGITERLNAIGVKDSIIIEQVSIRDIDFPQSYKDTITAKMNMDTEIARKNLEVQVAEAEARKAVATATGEANANIERARGEAEANKIRTESLTPILLQYTFIESIKTNPKVMYVPVGENGLPLFKTIGDTT